MLGFDPNYTQDISAAAQAKDAAIYSGISGGFAELPVSALALKGGMTFAGVGGNPTGLYNTPKNVFMPRIDRLPGHSQNRYSQRLRYVRRLPR